MFEHVLAAEWLIFPRIETSFFGLALARLAANSCPRKQPMPSSIELLPASFSPRLVPEGFRVGINGVYGQDGDDWIRLTSAPCWVSVQARDPVGGQWSASFHMLTPDGDERLLEIPYTNLSGNGITGVIREFADNGLVVLASDRSFRVYLAECAGQCTLPKVTTIRRLGFFRMPATSSQPEALGFMLPKRILVPGADGDAASRVNEFVFRPIVEGPSLAAYDASGTLQEWQGYVEQLRGSPLHVFCICAGLASIFVSPIGLENGGLNFYGSSSSGKTTALQLGLSIWGRGADPQRAAGEPILMERWHSTPNAMETVAATHSHMLLALDELGSGSGQDIYNLVGGAGKARMTETGGRRTALTWSIFVLSTGEISIQDKIESDQKRRARTGELIRVIDVPVDQLPAAETAGVEDMRQLIDEVKEACGRVYGVAGPAFVQEVIETYTSFEDLLSDWRAALDEEQQRLCAEVQLAGRKLTAPQIRAMRRLALVGLIGQLACEHVLPFEVDEVWSAVRAIRDAWLAGASSISEGQRAIESIRDYVIRNHSAFINHDELLEDPGMPIVSRPQGIFSRSKILLTDRQLEEACGMVPKEAALSQLEADGLLHRPEKGNRKAKHSLSVLGFKGVRFYTIHYDRLMSETRSERNSAEGEQDEDR
ncbi:DUF927 domain-containing protein [Pseudomonas zhanjiangensis]|uniref:DUF927 domain-containing protein n=1 Tax=Pseudomonas zhanjiangensis TaxID=3239015 RepID=A0ABV3YUK3_9PSED